MNSESEEITTADVHKVITQMQEILKDCSILRRNLKYKQLLEENDVGKSEQNAEGLNANADLCGLDYKTEIGEGELTEKGEAKLTNRSCAGEINSSSSEDLQKKLLAFEANVEKLQAQYKNILKGLKSKDLIITELNGRLSKINDKNKTLQTELSKIVDSEIAWASYHKKLEKQLEKKDWEISELQSKILKDDRFKNNLLKDIEYYKSELIFKDEEKRNTSDSELGKKYEEVKTEKEVLFAKLKEMYDSNEETQENLDKKINECNNLQTEIEDLKDHLTDARFEVEMLEAERKNIFSQYLNVLKNMNDTDKHLLKGESEGLMLKAQNSKLLSENNVYRIRNHKLESHLTVVEKAKRELQMRNNELVGDRAKFESRKETLFDLLKKAIELISERRSQNKTLNQDLHNSVTRAELLEGDLKTCRAEKLQLETDLKVSLARKEEITKQLECIKYESNDFRNAAGQVKIQVSKTKEDKDVQTRISVHDVACQVFLGRRTFEDKNPQMDALYERIFENCALIKRKMRSSGSSDEIQHFLENFMSEVVFEKQNVGVDVHYKCLLRRTSSLEERFKHLAEEYLKLNSGIRSNDSSCSLNGNLRNDLQQWPNLAEERAMRDLDEDASDLQTIDTKLNDVQETLLMTLHNLEHTKNNLYR